MPNLVVMDGPQKGRRFPISEATTRVGRVAGNHIVLDNLSVSSGHAEIIKSAEGFRLRDLDSTNGTRVNGHRVTDTLLFRNDEVMFGDLQVTFNGDDAPLRKETVKLPSTEVTVTPATVTRPTVVIASSASGKHVRISLPRDFRKRRDAKLLWVAVIALLLVGIVYGVWKFHNAVFIK